MHIFACVGTLVWVVPLDFHSLLQQLLMLNRHPNGTQNRTRTSLILQKYTPWMFNLNFIFFFQSYVWNVRMIKQQQVVCAIVQKILYITSYWWGGEKNVTAGYYNVHFLLFFHYLKVTSLKNEIFYAKQKKKFWVISKQFLSKMYDKKIMLEFSLLNELLLYNYNILSLTYCVS